MKLSKQTAKNYAQALFELGNNDLSIVETFLTEIKSINEFVEMSSDIKKIFQNPVIPKEGKKKLVETLGRNASKTIGNFLYILIDKNRFNLLPEIQNLLENLINKQKGIVIAEVYSAQEIEESKAKKIVETLRQSVSTSNTLKDIKIEKRLDPSLIGGIKVKINDLVYDGSIRGRLENLKRRLR